MTNPLPVRPFYDVATLKTIFPQKQDPAIKQESDKIFSTQAWCSRCQTVTRIVLGTLLMGGGVFLILSLKGVIPLGLNTSGAKLGWGYFGSSVSLMIGVIFALSVIATCKHESQQNTLTKKLLFDGEYALSCRETIPAKLNANEGFAIYNPELKNLVIYRERGTPPTEIYALKSNQIESKLKEASLDAVILLTKEEMALRLAKT